MQNNDTLLKQFCDDLHIGLVICTDDLSISYHNNTLNKLFPILHQQLSQYTHYQKGKTYWFDDQPTSRYQLKVRWDLYKKTDNALYFTIRVIEKSCAIGKQDHFSASLLDKLAILAFSKKRNGEFIYANEHFYQYTDQSNLLGKTVYDIYDASTAKQITKLDEFAFSTGETQAAYVYITPKKDIFLSIRCPQLHLGEPIISVVSINLKHAHHSILKQYLNRYPRVNPGF